MRSSLLVLITCMYGCGDLQDAGFEAGTEQRRDNFGIITHNQAREWSALWKMGRDGTIDFCIRGADASKDREVQDASRAAVRQWTRLLSDGPPASGYPAWGQSKIRVTFQCESDTYTINMINGRSNANVERQRINLDRNFRRYEMTHEFGHSMGMADTYSYQGGMIPNQPDSMMQTARQFTEDDRVGVWALWNYLHTGQVRCGPGYRESRYGNFRTDQLCEPSGDGGSCQNRYQRCDVWAADGGCDRYERFMKRNCCASCQDRQDDCRDHNRHCNYWAGIGECERNPGYMLDRCCASCAALN